MPIWDGLVSNFFLRKQVDGAQNTTPLGIYNEPTCDPSAVKSLTDLSLTCFLYRLAKVLPPADNPDVLQAEKIYRTYFPDPTNTSKEVNFEAGTLEAMSAVTRAVALLNLSVVNGIITGLTVNPYLFPFDPVIHQTKNRITEINWAFSRLRNSYSSLDNFVQSLNGKTVLTIGSRQLQFNTSITYPAILQFASLVLQDQSAILDQQMSNSATDQFQMMTSGLSPFLCATNSSCYTPGSSGSSQSNPSGGPRQTLWLSSI